MSKTHIFSASLVLLLGACDANDDAPPSAELVESSPTTQTSAPSGETVTLAVDGSVSELGFEGHKVVGSQTGGFERWSGEIALGETIEASRVSITIEMASVTTDTARLTDHLRTDDFFDVTNHPTATFEATSLEAAPAGGDATHLVTGTLSLRGTTETIRFPANIELNAQELRARANFTIDRQRWGINYRGMEDNLIQDDVTIHFDLRAPRSAQPS